MDRVQMKKSKMTDTNPHTISLSRPPYLLWLLLKIIHIKSARLLNQERLINGQENDLFLSSVKSGWQVYDLIHRLLPITTVLSASSRRKCLFFSAQSLFMTTSNVSFEFNLNSDHQNVPFEGV